MPVFTELAKRRDLLKYIGVAAAGAAIPTAYVLGRSTAPSSPPAEIPKPKPPTKVPEISTPATPPEPTVKPEPTPVPRPAPTPLPSPPKEAVRTTDTPRWKQEILVSENIINRGEFPTFVIQKEKLFALSPERKIVAYDPFSDTPMWQSKKQFQFIVGADSDYLYAATDPDLFILDHNGAEKHTIAFDKNDLVHAFKSTPTRIFVELVNPAETDERFKTAVFDKQTFQFLYKHGGFPYGIWDNFMLVGRADNLQAVDLEKKEKVPLPSLGLPNARHFLIPLAPEEGLPYLIGVRPDSPPADSIRSFYAWDVVNKRSVWDSRKFDPQGTLNWLGNSPEHYFFKDRKSEALFVVNRADGDLVWKIEIPTSFTADRMFVYKNLLFVITEKTGARYTFVYDVQKTQKVWEMPLAPKFTLGFVDNLAIFGDWTSTRPHYVFTLYGVLPKDQGQGIIQWTTNALVYAPQGGTSGPRVLKDSLLFITTRGFETISAKTGKPTKRVDIPEPPTDYEVWNNLLILQTGEPGKQGNLYAYQIQS